MKRKEFQKINMLILASTRIYCEMGALLEVLTVGEKVSSKTGGIC